MTATDVKKNWTLKQWLSYLETLHPSDIELGLDRVAKVAARLNLADDKVKVVTVSGTNGKGTSCALLAAAFSLAGKKCALYSSPHLLDFRERIALPEGLVSESELIDAFITIEAKRGSVPLTYFEITTLAALVVFSARQLDYWILEVGLGGRLDAVNVIDADVALITSIAIDHCDYLGNDRESIGFEKAGTFRAEQIAICADPKPPLSVVRHAEAMGAILHTVGSSFSWHKAASGFEFQLLKHRQSKKVHCDSIASGLHPDNVVAVMHISELLGVLLTISQWRQLLKDFTMPGRWQSLQTQPSVIVDVAHNVAAAENLLINIEKFKPKDAKCVCVLGMLADKQVTDVINVLARQADQIVAVDLSFASRGLSHKQLAALAPKGLTVSSCGDMTSVREYLRVNTSEADLVVVCGSFLTAQAAIEEWRHG